MAIIALGAISLISDIVGIAQWPQTPMVWITIVAGVAALLLGLPAVWIWHARQPRTLRTDGLFVLAVIVSLVGASFVSGGVVSSGHGPFHVAGNGSTNGQSPGKSSGKSGSIRHQGTVALNTEHQIDLDSLDPGWGVIDVSSPGNETNVPTEPDLQEMVGAVTAINGAQLALSTDISYQGCRGATGYGDQLSYDNPGIKTATFCVKTNEGNYAGLRITALDTESTARYFVKIQYSVTVWAA